MKWSSALTKNRLIRDQRPMTYPNIAGHEKGFSDANQVQRVTIVAAVRDVGDARRQKVLSYLAERANIVSVPVELPPVSRYLNLIRAVSYRKAVWRDRSKRNAYYFRHASRALAEAIHKETNGAHDLIMLFEALYAPYTEAHECKPYLIYEDSTTALALRVWPQWVPDEARTFEYRKLETQYYRGAARILASNERARQSLILDYEIPSDKVITIGQGCDSSPTALKGQRAAELVLFVGYDFERKGGPCLIEAFRRVRKCCPSAKLLIVGAEVRLSEPGVEVAGQVRDRATLLELYRRASVFVLPASYDPMPHAAMEAMSLEIPIIVSTDCGASELIDDGKNGFIVPVGDATILAERIISLLSDPPHAMAIGKAGAEILRHNYSWERVASRIYKIALEVLSERQ